MPMPRNQDFTDEDELPIGRAHPPGDNFDPENGIAYRPTSSAGRSDRAREEEDEDELDESDIIEELDDIDDLFEPDDDD